jgi:hypothetical protein
MVGRRGLSELNLNFTELAPAGVVVALPFKRKEVLRPSLMHGPN